VLRSDVVIQHCNNGVCRSVEKYEIAGTAVNSTVYSCNFLIVGVVTRFFNINWNAFCSLQIEVVIIL